MAGSEKERCDLCVFAVAERTWVTEMSLAGFAVGHVKPLRCRRLPGEVGKAADDWCGEFRTAKPGRAK